MRIELHSVRCSCRGGSWVLLAATKKSPCAGPEAEAAEKLVLSAEEWREYGKPGTLEALNEIQQRMAGGERRQFTRYEARVPVRLSRIATWRDSSAQAEDTLTEVLAEGGALVRSRMAIEKGEMVLVSVGPRYKTRAEVTYVAPGAGAAGEQCLGLKFLDAPLPADLIPADAVPLP